MAAEPLHGPPFTPARHCLDPAKRYLFLSRTFVSVYSRGTPPRMRIGLVLTLVLISCAGFILPSGGLEVVQSRTAGAGRMILLPQVNCDIVKQCQLSPAHSLIMVHRCLFTRLLMNNVKIFLRSTTHKRALCAGECLSSDNFLSQGLEHTAQPQPQP